MRDTGIGGENRDFPSTRWSTILAARRLDRTSGRESLERLVGRYWKPVYSYIRALGSGAALGPARIEDAKDLTQAFFARLLEKGVIERLSPERGSFRGFLKRAVKNFLVDAVRRKRARLPARGSILPLEESQVEREMPPARDPEEVFEREWRLAVMRGALEELESRLEARNLAGHFEVFRAYCLPGASSEEAETREIDAEEIERPTYRGVASSLGITPDAVKKRLARCRRELHEIARERILEYVGDPEEFEAEFERITGVRWRSSRGPSATSS